MGRPHPGRGQHHRESIRRPDPALTAAGLRRLAADYTSGRDPTHPQISPLFADLTGLPPLLIQAGSNEILLDDATRLAARAASRNVAVTLDVTPDAPHVFHAFAAILDEADTAVSTAGAFLHTHRPHSSWQHRTTPRRRMGPRWGSAGPW